MKQEVKDAREIREISLAELKNWKKDEYVLADIRNEIVYQHGFIPNAISVPCHRKDEGDWDLCRNLTEKLPREKYIVVYCQRGEESREIVKWLCGQGYEAYNLQGGYIKWLIENACEIDVERYSRHILLESVGLEGQKKLLHSKVLVVGAGGLGAPAAMYLAAAGVGTIGIVDDDRVELSNLQRQIIHTTQNIGKQKVKSAQEMLGKLNPDVNVITYCDRVTPKNVRKFVEAYDFVIDGVDNFEAKFLINDACVLGKKPFCHGGILQFQGQVLTYVPGQGPCYRCIFEEIPKAGSIPNCREAGVLGVMAGVIGSLQALEALKYLLGVGELLTGRILIFDGLTMKFREAVFAGPSSCCRVCGKNAVIRSVEENAAEYEQKGQCDLL